MTHRRKDGADNRVDIDSLGFNAQSIADVDRHNLTFGLDFYTDHLQDHSLSSSCGYPCTDFDTSTAVAVPKSDQTGLGAYVQDGWAISQAFTLQMGLRGDTFSFVTDKNDPNYPGEPFDVTESAVSGTRSRSSKPCSSFPLRAVRK